ncbi:hypothetical protein [Shinella kummerowiae]|jgi:hypothetical protein|uniref:PhnA-like protein n=1 Tax=Shinella kummerowiae TaxID=417745 RepID=A0A6N8SJH9_9HYPH|nr:hypothetical protein [Shinella kummerowiae]MCT7668027.1 hypothetical protein [Shinella kummerowiae]MXN49235.1 hypothetical protein [Shinella kummerowiae]
MSLYGSDVSDVGVESSTPALAWGPVIGGSVAAAATTIILLLLGSGVGLTMVSPWAGESASFTAVSVTAAIWFVVVQWLASAFGGYLTGRLRTKWAGIHTDEVFFRDTAHGFLSWALATIVVAGLAGSAFTSLAGTGVQAASTAAATATVAGSAAAANSDAWPDSATGYFTDLLLRPQDLSTRAQGDDASATAEISRILVQGAVNDGVPEADRAYMSAIVASRAGVTPEEARARVDQVLQQVEDAKNAALKAADEARKSAATVAMLGALSLLAGAFIASASAALGGRQRDDEEAALIVKR